MNMPRFYNSVFHFKYYEHNAGKVINVREAMESLKKYDKNYLAVREEYKLSFGEICGKEASRE